MMLSQISAPTSPVYNSNSTACPQYPDPVRRLPRQPSRQKEDISESCLGRMPKENYEGIKAAASQDIPISSLRVAAPRRRRRRQHVAAVALSAGGSGRRDRVAQQRRRPHEVRVFPSPIPQQARLSYGRGLRAAREVRCGAPAAGTTIAGAETGRGHRAGRDQVCPTATAGTRLREPCVSHFVFIGIARLPGSPTGRTAIDDRPNRAGAQV